jgi:long-chain acyl-CoA synthetase
MKTLEEIEADLLAPGGPFAIVEEEVLGERIPVFADRLPSVRALLEASAGFGDQECLVCGDERITFVEHSAEVASLAAALRDHYHVVAGDRVAILAANSTEWILSWWATVSLGAIAVGLNGWWSGDEIRFGIDDCAPRVLIGDARRLARIDRAAIGVPTVEIESEFRSLREHAPGSALPDAEIEEDAPATILYTSGTTGRPKGAVTSHRAIVAAIRLSLFHGIRMTLWGASRGLGGRTAGPTVMLVNSPLFHISGLFNGAVMVLATGAKSVWMKGRFDPVRVMQLIEGERVTSWGPMGTMAHRVAYHPEAGRYDLSSLRNVGSGGAPVSAELQQRMRDVFPNAGRSMGIGYGLTETTSMISVGWGDELEARPDTVGRPLPGLGVEIRDEKGHPVAEGVEGEIHARGATVMREYWRRSDATAETLLPGRWLRTGDWGRLEDGRLFVNSRKRDLILRGGENVYPAEIEHCLEAHPDVVEAAVLGVEHPELGQEVKAIVVSRGEAALEEAALAEWVRGRLAAFKVPVHWELRREPLPRNASGKILKSVLAGEAENPFVEE